MIKRERKSDFSVNFLILSFSSRPKKAEHVFQCVRFFFLKLQCDREHRDEIEANETKKQRDRAFIEKQTLRRRRLSFPLPTAFFSATSSRSAAAAAAEAAAPEHRVSLGARGGHHGPALPAADAGSVGARGGLL